MTFAVLTILTLLLVGYFCAVSFRPLFDMFQNRLLYQSYLTRAEQALVEKNLSRLSRVLVMCDRVDPPTLGFLDAVRDNFFNNVQYVFLVSSRTTEDALARYARIFENIGESVRLDRQAREECGEEYLDDVPAVDAPAKLLFEIHRLRQDWDDYPYICYEFTDDLNNTQYLMYRGGEIGVGIAEDYVRVAPEIAYSLVKRADALKGYIAAEPDKFATRGDGDLQNEPPRTVVPGPWKGGERGRVNSQR